MLEVQVPHGFSTDTMVGAVWAESLSSGAIMLGCLVVAMSQQVLAPHLPFAGGELGHGFSVVFGWRRVAIV